MGRHPDEERRGLARRLRAAGYTLKEIGQQMEISHQAPGHLIGGILVQVILNRGWLARGNSRNWRGNTVTRLLR
jgi:DNA-binding transcriptional MerR regulator